MRLSPIAIALAAAAMLPTAAYAKDDKPVAAKSADAYIPFVNHGGVRDWRADGDRTIYFQDAHRRWYKAELMSPAFDLPFTEFIAIDGGPSDRLDSFGSVYVKGQRYPFRSFEAIDGQPPKKGKKPKAG